MSEIKIGEHRHIAYCNASDSTPIGKGICVCLHALRDSIRIIPAPGGDKQPTAIDISLHQMKDNRWEAAVYGFNSPKYIYGDTLNQTLLNVVMVVSASSVG